MQLRQNSNETKCKQDNIQMNRTNITKYVQNSICYISFMSLLHFVTILLCLFCIMFLYFLFCLICTLSPIHYSLENRKSVAQGHFQMFKCCQHLDFSMYNTQRLLTLYYSVVNIILRKSFKSKKYPSIIAYIWFSILFISIWLSLCRAGFIKIRIAGA